MQFVIALKLWKVLRGEAKSSKTGRFFLLLASYTGLTNRDWLSTTYYLTLLHSTTTRTTVTVQFVLSVAQMIAW